MDFSTSGSVEEVERQRLNLEENITKLRNGLQHWRESEIEYGCFKEQLEALEAEPTPVAMLNLGKSLNSTVMTEEELGQIIGLDKGLKRDRNRVIGVLTRRMDYVQQNSQSLQRQLGAREKELEELLGAEVVDEASDGGLPVMEIMEELDDDGNVISSSVSSTKDAASGVADLLKKAGVTDSDRHTAKSNPLAATRAEPDGLLNDSVEKEGTRERRISHGPPETLSASPSNDTKQKKSVSFADNVSVSPSPLHRPTSPPLSDLPPTPIKSKSTDSWKVKEARAGRFHEGNRVIELNDDDEEIGTLPVVGPVGEDETLRREMQQYALGEVGAIVAEMNLEDDSESSNDFDDELGDDELDEDEDESDENEYGMRTQDLISGKEREAMVELEKKLEARFLQNLGPRLNQSVMIGVGGDASKSAEMRAEPVEKVVHFSSDIEVVPSLVAAKNSASDEAENQPTPATEQVVERAASATGDAAKSKSSRKASRFKNSITNTPSHRSAQIPIRRPPIPIYLQQEIEEPSTKNGTDGPPGQTHSNNVVERPNRCRATPPDDTGLDPALLRQEAAVENRRMLNKRVHQQGGFKPSLEDEDYPIMEEREGKVQKVSRFKAARLKEAGM